MYSDKDWNLEDMMRIWSWIFVLLWVLFISSTLFAHKVNIFAYVEGDTVYTESYFPDGKKVEGGIIEVYDSSGTKLLEGKTDKKGVFNFRVPKKDDLKIVLIASMGHKSSYLLSSEEIGEIQSSEHRYQNSEDGYQSVEELKIQRSEDRGQRMEELRIQSSGDSVRSLYSEGRVCGTELEEGKEQRIESREAEKTGVEVSLEQIEKIVGKSMKEKLKPVMRELKKLEERRVTFTDVIGGIGYIFGVMGIIMYFLSKNGK